jgi:hypothetical protein
MHHPSLPAPATLHAVVRNSAGGKRVGYYDSLESVHNSLHVWIGGGGHVVSSNIILIPSVVPILLTMTPRMNRTMQGR